MLDFESIDKLVDHYLDEMVILDIFDFLIKYRINEIYSTLLNRTNKPSKYDISILNAFINTNIYENNYILTIGEYVKTANSILKIYSDRKE